MNGKNILKHFFFFPLFFFFLILSVRAKMLKEAEATATEELKIFRAKEKERLTKGHKEKSTAEDEIVTKIEQNTKDEIKRYKDLFKKNKDQVAQFVYDKVFKVDIDIPDCVQKYM
ncbi:hypothetical protein, variant [Plasmodium yoelii 17X]|nr:hypothetical protein, variant [Plasmodium yoelii 17X]